MIGKIHIAMLGVGLAIFLGPQLAYAGPGRAERDDFRQFRQEHQGQGHFDHGEGLGLGHDCDRFGRGKGHRECEVSRS